MQHFEQNSFELQETEFILEEIVNELHNLYDIQMNGKKINFKIEVPESDEKSKFTLDWQRLMQILINLVNNSIQYTNWGEIAVSMSI